MHADHLGAPQKLTDETGAVVWDATFRPYGEEDAITGAADTNQRFPGQYFDIESALHYNYQRHYDPATGRYLQSDRIGLAGGLNTYAYVGGNPIKYIDLSGLMYLPPNWGFLPRPRPQPRPVLACSISEKREKECEENLGRDLATCAAIGRRGGKEAYRICEQQAYLRYGNCLSGRDERGINAPLPPFPPRNN